MTNLPIASRVIGLSFLLTITSCTGMLETGVAGPRGPGSPGDPEGPSACPPLPGSNSRTDQIRIGLEPTCKGCHLTGDSGYFASLNAFESLLVRNSRLIRPGNPEESELVMLLEGRRNGDSMTQMPLGGDPFAVLSDRGETNVTIEEIRDWITNLEAPAASTATNPQVATVQRISAAHIELGLSALLGLTIEDFYDHNVSSGLPVLALRTYDSYSVHHPDRAPMEWDRATTSNFGTLGGGSGLYTQTESRSVSTGFVQTLVPMSQAWCEMAINKVGNTALFDIATSNTGTSEMSLLREQVANWHLTFLAEVPTESDIDLVVDQVFAPLEASSNTRKA